MTPTIKDILKCYPSIAKAERVKTGGPGAETVTNAIRGTRKVCRAAGIALGSGIDNLTRQNIDKALVVFMEQGLSRMSAWSYAGQLRAIFARWCLPYYKDIGWDIPPLELPTFRAKPPRYVRPPHDILKRVRPWYERIRDKYVWFAATMMLEFAMRNSDVLRLKRENFIEKDSKIYLNYTPHKTALSSGRRVMWPIHEKIWRKMKRIIGKTPEDFAAFAQGFNSGAFTALNKQVRALGFHGHKASYELRKICIDHIYQQYGVEMAVSISGDSIKTISYYYADPSQPNIGAIRIIDLL